LVDELFKSWERGRFREPKKKIPFLYIYKSCSLLLYSFVVVFLSFFTHLIDLPFGRPFVSFQKGVGAGESKKGVPVPAQRKIKGE
jgi:hypothetical protein